MAMSRRALLTGAAGGAVALAAGAGGRVPAVVGELEEKILAGMRRFDIPGVALGLRYRGVDYVRGYGVAEVGKPAMVDGDTVFRVGSTTKTFTGTAVMRLVERGTIDLDRTVRSYLPGFRDGFPAATVRQALNHSAGWLGDYFYDTGADDQALARYVGAMGRVPQQTPPGKVFAYNNAALGVAGRLVEVAAGVPYEEAIRSLITGPLRLDHSSFFPDDSVTVAMSHVFGPDGTQVPSLGSFAMPRSIHPAGGLISSVRDQLRWARFHMGDGGRVLSRRSLRLMRSRPGPGGALFVELDGMGVTWMVRPTAEGTKVIQHGGDWEGQHSGFLMVPGQDFALTVLTNSETGPDLLDELFVDDWALARFAGLHNLPAKVRPESRIADYLGYYTLEQIGFDGAAVSITLEAVAVGGELSLRYEGEELFRLGFYRKDFVRFAFPDGTYSNSRSSFVRDRHDRVEFYRYGGRLMRRTDTPPAALAKSAGSLRFPKPTLPYPVRG
ncbi:serine hydrolase domain-containing protein [Winogradskya consettensis]|uniref:serine hydrolase domain-containing protein n=1 Tax=Winogradskya consettensis TaxID=113560 RepID=UPI001BB2EFAD|nr:serine hydrolase domain-containing protein [Actinoplanes consettensis]